MGGRPNQANDSGCSLTVIRSLEFVPGANVLVQTKSGTLPSRQADHGKNPARKGSERGYSLRSCCARPEDASERMPKGYERTLKHVKVLYRA
jgi:hypothetical protein